MSKIKLPSEIFTQIMSVMGCPFVTIAPDNGEAKLYDLELSEEQIKTTIIELVFQEYFRWFPIETSQLIQVSGPIAIDFPNKSIFTVRDMHMTTKVTSYGLNTNAWLSLNSMYGVGGYMNGAGLYGTRNDYGTTPANIVKSIEAQSWTDKVKTFKWTVSTKDRQVQGFSNVTGTAEIIWAGQSYDWDDVEFTKQMDVLKLCQGKVLEYFGYLRLQQEIADSPVELNGQSLVDRGKDLIDSVYEKWQEYSAPVIMRG